MKNLERKKNKILKKKKKKKKKTKTGCNMEGISTEAASLAGHWGLGKLIVLYDDNKISIDGHTDISFTEDVSARFDALGWHTQHVADGNTDLDAIRKAIETAKSVTDKPSMIKVSTLIGYGSPNKADSHDVHGKREEEEELFFSFSLWSSDGDERRLETHFSLSHFLSYYLSLLSHLGAPLGKDETAATRENLGWKYGAFEVRRESCFLFSSSFFSGVHRVFSFFDTELTFFLSLSRPSPLIETPESLSGPQGRVRRLRQGRHPRQGRRGRVEGHPRQLRPEVPCRGRRAPVAAVGQAARRLGEVAPVVHARGQGPGDPPALADDAQRARAGDSR